MISQLKKSIWEKNPGSSRVTDWKQISCCLGLEVEREDNSKRHKRTLGDENVYLNCHSGYGRCIYICQNTLNCML